MNPRSRTIVIAVSIAVVAVLVAVVAMAMAGGGDDSATADTSPVATDDSDATAPTGDLSENQPVEVVGPVLAPLVPNEPDAAVGATAPTLQGASFDGTPVTIGGASENYTLAVFLAHWCPHCNAEIPELNELRDAGTLPDNLDIVGVSTAVAPDRPNYPPSEWVVEKDWTWPVLADDEQASAFMAYGGSGFPFLVVLDPEGNVVARKSGEDSAADILEWIEEALGSSAG